MARKKAIKEENIETEIQFLPMFEGAQVTRILDEFGSFNHCKMSDGTTKHVPKSLFISRPKTRVNGEYIENNATEKGEV